MEVTMSNPKFGLILHAHYVPNGVSSIRRIFPVLTCPTKSSDIILEAIVNAEWVTRLARRRGGMADAEDLKSFGR